MVEMPGKPDKVRLLVIGAHPDDCDVAAGGLAALYARDGHVVKFLSMTNGDTGHHEIGGGDLARRRYAETQASAAVIGIDYDVNDQHCGALMPSLENRNIVIRAIRTFKPDLVLTHPPDDYHPDHRYTSVLVQDSAYLVMVPGNLALTPHLTYNPVYAYMAGTVTVSRSFAPTVFFDITPVIQKKLDMLCCHTSQWLEWIPYNQGRLDEVPHAPAEQRRWMIEWWDQRLKPFAEKHRAQLIEQFGKGREVKIDYAEGIEVCPFGAQVTDASRARLFPFLPT